MNVFFIVFITGSSYYHTPLNGLKDSIIYLIHLLLLQLTVAGILYFFSLNKVIFKIVFPVFYMIYGIIAFWVYTLDISVSSSLIDATLQSKLYIIKDLITFQFFIFLFFQLISLYIIFRYYRTIETTKGYRFLSILSISLVSVFFIVENKRYNTFKSKLPYKLYYSIKEYNSKPILELLDVSKRHFRSEVDSLKVVLVIGESVRADHLGINGYHRNTTPQLAKKKDSILSVKSIYTNKTYTAVSLSQILTNMSIYEDKNVDEVSSIYSVLKNADVYTSWVGNQLLEFDYKPIIESNEKVTIIDELKSVYSFHKLKDNELLPFLKRDLQLKSEKSLISLHMIGSHWWYEDKYTDEFRKFTPVVDSKYIPSMTNDQMINSYDNTILYLDSFLSEVIGILQEETSPIMMLYISDHGESLGENGKWLHAHNDESLTNPAMIVWVSEKFKEKYPHKTEYLDSLYLENNTTDLIYPLILDLFEIKEY